MTQNVRRAWIAWLAAAGLLACVSQDLDQARAAREAHERCVAIHSPDDERCKALEEKAKAAERHYEGNTEDAFGCDASLPCPITP